MEITAHSVNDTTLLNISGDFTVYEVSEVHKTLLEYVENGTRFILNLEEVGECDTAAVQLLFSLYKTTAGQGQAVQIKGMSQSVRSAFDRIGMNPEDVGFSASDN